MTRKVLKFGGTSVGSIDRIKKVAKTIKEHHDKGDEIIVVVSAMSGVTNNLIKKANSISNNFDKAELDVLLATGEQETSSLMAGALNEIGVASRSWLSWQVPIITEGNHNSARILNIRIKEIEDYLSGGKIPIFPGFQGMSIDGRITTIGRGGSDGSAVAIAKIFNAEICEIYTDVEGVLTSDPGTNKDAKKIEKISFEEMLEMSSLGAKVMQPYAVQTAMMNNIPIQVRSSFSKNIGTFITDENSIDYKKNVTGVTYSKNDAKISILGVKDRPGIAAGIFEPLGVNEINVDMVVQNISANKSVTDITFTLKREDTNKALDIIKKSKEKINYNELLCDDKVSKISIVGAGMIFSPGITYRMFKALGEEKINILVIYTSEIKISVLIDENFTQKAVRVLHKEFKLG